MRLTSIEEVKNFVPVDHNQNTYTVWILELHNKKLRDAFARFAYMQIGGQSNIPPEFRINWEYLRRNSSSLSLHQLYTFLLCYVPNPPHPYRNVMNYVKQNWDECKDLTPDFHLLREWCHTYKYNYDRINSDIRCRNLLTVAPDEVLKLSNFAAYNKYLLSFVRPSEVNETNYSFVPDENHLHKDVQVSTSIGRLIPRIFDNPYLAKQVINKIVGTSLELKIAETAEEITKVYNEGPRSCMKGLTINAEGYAKPLNPAAIYNTEDVGVIYCDRGGVITGRAVINKHTRKFVRQYGDSYFTNALRQAGYVEDMECLKDCHLQLIYMAGSDDIILLPFIDGDYMNVSIMGDLLKINNRGEICAEFTSGIYNLKTDEGCEGEPCENCDEYVNPNDMTEVDGYMWCDYCTEHDAVEVQVSVRRVELLPAHRDFIEIDFDYFLNENVARECGYRETIDGEWHHKDDVYEYEGDYFTIDQLKDEGLKLNEDNEVCKDDIEDEAA